MKLLVDHPSGEQQIEFATAGTVYFDPTLVVWDERTDGALPDITLGGMVRESNALVFSQARLDQHKAAIAPAERSALDVQREEALLAGVTYINKHWHSDDRFLMELIGMVLGYSAGVLSGTQNIRTMDNTTEALNQSQIVGLASAVGDYRKSVHAACWAAKDAL